MSVNDDTPANRFARLRADLGSQHRLRTLTDKEPCQASGPARLTIGGKPVLNFGGNDYLGLAANPAIVAAAQAAVARYGAGATGSRLLSGQLPLHSELERALADLKHKPRALVFPSGYQASVTLVSTLTSLWNPAPRIFLDKLCHASLIDGATLSQAKFQRFKHNQPADLAQYLARHPAGTALVVVESIYSMDGDVAPLADLHAVCQKYHAVLIVDDAHGTGVLGSAGSGCTESLAADENVVILGTLSKALGSQGGFVAAHAWAIEALIQFGRGFLFSTGLAPAAAGAALAAVKRLPGMDAERKHLAALRGQLAGEYAAAQPAGCQPQAAIVPVVVGAESRVLAVSEQLLTAGFYVPAVRPPTVPPGTARLRISLTAGHTQADVESLIRAIRQTGV